jgi:hypothetical protein
MSENHPNPRTQHTLIIVGAACCGFVAAAITTLVFLWCYGFTFYSEAFFGRSLPILSSAGKFLVFAAAFLVWFIIFVKWVFKRANLPA